MEGSTSASPRTSTLGELLSWVAGEAETLRRHVPYAINDADGDLEWDLDETCSSSEVIGGMPFTHSFESYVLRRFSGRYPIVRALSRLKDSAGGHSRLYQVCLHLLWGQSAETVRAAMKLDGFQFTTAALHGLSSLKAKTAFEETRQLAAA